MWWIVGVGGLALAAGLPPADANVGAGATFVTRDDPLVGYALFDLGVVDANGDGVFDIFSTNHNERQSFLVSVGGQDQDQTSQWRLDQDVAFPGWEDSS
ncbi:hypothetical protein BH18ACT4_BH18ACT4_12690 [soil metagenome]